MNKLNLSLCILVAIFSTSCHSQKSRPATPPTKVVITQAKIDSIYSQITLTSQIEGMSDAVIQPRVNGFLVATHFLGGMPVKRGELLFTIDPASFSTTLFAARAALESAKASEVLAERNYQRAIPLAQIDAISQSDLDQYRATYKSAMASTKSAQENLRQAELEIGYTKIYAPLSGIASKTTAAVGDYIGPGTLQSQLTTISQLDTVSVKLPIASSKYLLFTKNGLSDSFDNSTLLSDITLTLADSSTYNHKGEYYYTLKNTPTESSTVVVVAKFPNPDMLLKEGMFARVKANIGPARGCVSVPKAAVSQLQGINSVWVIRPDSTAQWREVSLGDGYGGQWEITSGLAEGENVVVSGGVKLHNGVKVAAREAK
ncbi:MAG: efflux RND transporter periplasmic adaptor subunit [Rikenellaceae bacterium]